MNYNQLQKNDPYTSISDDGLKMETLAGETDCTVGVLARKRAKMTINLSNYDTSTFGPLRGYFQHVNRSPAHGSDPPGHSGFHWSTLL